MKIKQRAFPLQVKEIEASGEFAGYLSVFHNVDAYREVVMPGAFAETLQEWAARDRLPPVLWQHNSREPIGPFTKMHEDETGLYVEGRLLVDDLQKAREAHALLKAGVISGMSIGFETIGEEWDRENRLTKLTKVKLWEGSIVTFPANEAANVEEVKSVVQLALEDGQLPTLKEFEKYLREAGFSKTQATAIAGHGLAKLHRSESGEPAEDPLQHLLAAIQNAH